MSDQFSDQCKTCALAGTCKAKGWIKTATAFIDEQKVEIAELKADELDANTNAQEWEAENKELKVVIVGLKAVIQDIKNILPLWLDDEYIQFIIQEAEQQAKLEAEEKVKVQADAKLVAEQQAKAQADAQAKLVAEQQAKAQADAQAKLIADQQAIAQAEAQTILIAEQQAKAQAKLVADQQANEERISNAQDEVGKSMYKITEQAEDSKTAPSPISARSLHILNLIIGFCSELKS